MQPEDAPSVHAVHPKGCIDQLIASFRFLVRCSPSLHFLHTIFSFYSTDDNSGHLLEFLPFSDFVFFCSEIWIKPSFVFRFGGDAAQTLGNISL